MKKLFSLLIILFLCNTVYSSELDSKIKTKVKPTGVAIEFSFDDTLAAITTGIGKPGIIDDENNNEHDVKIKKPSKIKAVTFPQVYFSPGIQDVLIKFIHDENKNLSGAWYEFTLYKAAEAIITGMKKRKITASLIVNGDYQRNFCVPLKCIIKNGGKVYAKDKERNRDKPGKYEHMHHKFMIFEDNVDHKKLIWTGSFNATGQADLKNCENVVILDDPESIKKFEEEFATVLNCSTQLKVEDCISTKDTDPKSKFARTMNNIPNSSLQ